MEGAGRRSDHVDAHLGHGFENHTRAVRAEGAAVRQLLESAFADQPDLRFHGGRRYVGDDFVVSEWTATATDAEGRASDWDGIDAFPFRDGRRSAARSRSTGDKAHLLGTRLGR